MSSKLLPFYLDPNQADRSATQRPAFSDLIRLIKRWSQRHLALLRSRVYEQYERQNETYDLMKTNVWEWASSIPGLTASLRIQYTGLPEWTS